MTTYCLLLGDRVVQLQSLLTTHCSIVSLNGHSCSGATVAAGGHPSPAVMECQWAGGVQKAACTLPVQVQVSPIAYLDACQTQPQTCG